MIQALLASFGVNDLVPHGYCLSWNPALLWTTVLSDATMVLGYGSYPIAVTYFVWKRKDLQYRWLYLAFFNGFILTCTATHLMSVVTVWNPQYWVAAYVNALSAVVSVATVFAIWWVIPRALTLPSPEELKVQRSAAEYARSLIEASLDPLVTISPEGKITDLNQATERATGRSRSELIGTDFSDYFTEPDKAREAYTEVFAQGAVTDFPLALRHCDGHITDVLYNASVYCNEAGKVLGVFAAARDVTELKKAEERITELNRDLERRVAGRTAELEAANKELEAFSYSVSHDLRAPLRAIDGFSQVLLEDYKDRLDDEGRQLLSRVRNSTSRMAQLITDILHFSRVGRSGMSISTIDMDGLVQDVLDELKPLLAEHPMPINVGPLPEARGDRAMIYQVVENLLSNAIKFCGKKADARIDVDGRTEDGKTHYYVKDNGAGFDMKFADRLFGVFQRLHRADEFEGTGIGLAIVKRIIARHGGEVWAEGEVGQGATFYFSIPIQGE